MIDQQTIDEIKEAQAILESLHKKGIYGVDKASTYNSAILITAKAFNEFFPKKGYEISDSGTYIKKSITYDGIQFVALYKLCDLSVADIQRFVQKEG